MQTQLYTIEEVAAFLKVTKMSVYRYVKAGKLEAYKAGKDLRVSQDGLDRFLASIKIKPS